MSWLVLGSILPAALWCWWTWAAYRGIPDARAGHASTLTAALGWWMLIHGVALVSLLLTSLLIGIEQVFG